MDRLRHALARGERSGTASALLLLDLDRFGLVNDSFGHAAGDQLLAAVARRLLGSVRPGDTVARFGGDEFVVLLEAVASVDEAIRVADRIAEGLGEPFALGDRDGFVTASIGIALAQPGRDGAGEVLRNADIAMYRAKADAATRHAVFEPAMSAPAMERLELENNLRRAIDRDELRLWFQPLLELSSGRLVGHEALLRWHHPTRGLLLPASFIPLAEETGLILPLGQWVLDAACRQARTWRDETSGVPGAWPLAMSVNLSAREFGQPDLVAKVAAALDSNGLEPSLLELEITESVVMSDAEAVIMRLHQLRGLGVHLVLDDFGTGYSSLSYLRRLPLDVIKVDRSFVAAVTSDPATRSIVNAVVSLAHGLGMSVTAEGIETADQLAIMRELGCDVAQGNYYAEAMSTERLTVARLTQPRVVVPGAAGTGVAR
jgi:diguanylate cyclase (GGDEF)-like protein